MAKKGKGRGGAKRHTKRRSPLQLIYNSSIRNLARRAGVKRISYAIYGDTRRAIDGFLN